MAKKREVAIESTAEYVDKSIGFVPDMTTKRVVNKFRLVTIKYGLVKPYDKEVFKSRKFARQHIYDEPKLIEITYDDLIQKASSIQREKKERRERQVESKKDVSQKSYQDKEQKLYNNIKNMINSYQIRPEMIAELLEFKTRFYQYSLNNTILIYTQNPFATYVQSFSKWKEMGANVRRGEKGIAIFVPVKKSFIKYKSEPQEVWTPLSEASKNMKRDLQLGKMLKQDKLYFKVGHVFDISQTDYPPEKYPQLFSIGHESKDHAKICVALEKFSEEVLKVPVYYEDVKSISLRGIFSKDKNRIILSNILKDTEKLATLSHEIGHAIMSNQSNEKLESKAEIEADAISIMIQADLGLEITDNRKKHFADHYREYERVATQKCEVENTLNNFQTDINKCLLQVCKVFENYKETIDTYIDRERSPHFSQHKRQEKAMNTKELDK